METPRALVTSSHLVEAGSRFCGDDEEDDFADARAELRDEHLERQGSPRRTASYRDAVGRLVVGTLATALLLLLAAPARAQTQVAPAVPDVSLPSAGEVLALDAGERAPHAGMLVLDDDLFALQSELAGARLRLTADAQLAAQVLEARLAQERARTTAAEERVQLHDGLWSGRQRELLERVALAERRAERQWWEHPALWVVIGLVVGVAGVVAVGVAVK